MIIPLFFFNCDIFHHKVDFTFFNISVCWMKLTNWRWKSKVHFNISYVLFQSIKFLYLWCNMFYWPSAQRTGPFISLSVSVRPCFRAIFVEMALHIFYRFRAPIGASYATSSLGFRWIASFQRTKVVWERNVFTRFILESFDFLANLLCLLLCSLYLYNFDQINTFSYLKSCCPALLTCLASSKSD